MKHIRYCIPAILIVLIVGCNLGNDSTIYTYDKEAERVARCSRIDTAAIPSIINPDTIEGYEALGKLSAEAWLLIEDGSGWVISSKNADEPLYMASLTKMMTGLLAIEYGHETDTLEITDDVFVTRRSKVKLGDAFQMGDLIREMMLTSDNDAAYALAKHVAGDTLSFYALMNEKAQYLGMQGTHFASPNGMPNDSNYSTAADLVRLTRYCLADSQFAEIVKTKEMDIPLTDGRHMPCRNTNALLHTYEGCIGVKTGYTRQAGNCLASAAERDSIRLCLVLLNSRSMSTRFKESAMLLDYGFNVMKAYREKMQ